MRGASSSLPPPRLLAPPASSSSLLPSFSLLPSPFSLLPSPFRLGLRRTASYIPPMTPTFGNGRRVAIVAGVRTPFAKAGTVLKDVSAIDLGKLAVAELVQRTKLDGKEVEALVFGTVVPSVQAPNIAREVSLLPMLPKGVQAFTREPRLRLGQPGDHRRRRPDRARPRRRRDRRRRRVAVERADPALARGSRDVARRRVAGEVAAAARLQALARACARGTSSRSRRRSPSRPPARRWGRARRRWRSSTASRARSRMQFALRSHRMAAAGTADGRLDRRDRAAVRAAGVRAGASTATTASARTPVARAARGAQAGVRPEVRHGDRRQRLAAHRRRGAVLLMSEERAKALGYDAARATSARYAYAALDPGEQLLHGAGARRAGGARSARA